MVYSMMSLVKKLSGMLLCCVLASAVSGCQAIKTIDSWNGALERPASERAEWELLKKAEAAYFAGDYNTAGEFFAKIRRTSTTEEHQNHALYGIACVEIVTAEQSGDVRAALSALQGWREPEKVKGGFYENPRMIISALRSRVDLLYREPEPQQESLEEEEGSSSASQKEREQQEQIAKLKEKIKTLEHQISVLEAIDQEIQEKRKPI